MDAELQLAVVNLRERDDLVPVVSDWYSTEWPSTFGGWEPSRFAEFLLARSAAERLPIILLCMLGGEPVGAIALRSDEIRGFEEYDPWIAGLYTLPAHRKRGVARFLVEQALREAGRQGFEHVYSGTRIATVKAIAADSTWEHVGETEVEDGETMELYRART